MNKCDKCNRETNFIFAILDEAYCEDCFNKEFTTVYRDNSGK